MNALQSSNMLEDVRKNYEKGLSNEQIEGIEYLIHREDNESTQDIADKLGVNKQTIYNWMRSRKFQLAYTERIQQLLIGHKGAITKKLLKAAKNEDSKSQIPAMTLYYKLQGLLQPENVTNVNAQFNTQLNVNSQSISNLENTQLPVERFPLVIKQLLMCLLNGCVLDTSTMTAIESYVGEHWPQVESRLAAGGAAGDTAGSVAYEGQTRIEQDIGGSDTGGEIRDGVQVKGQLNVEGTEGKARGQIREQDTREIDEIIEGEVIETRQIEPGIESRIEQEIDIDNAEVVELDWIDTELEKLGIYSIVHIMWE